jgi:hypothetical protein
VILCLGCVWIADWSPNGTRHIQALLYGTNLLQGVILDVVDGSFTGDGKCMVKKGSSSTAGAALWRTFA